ncbi:phospholipase D/nuclease [Pyrenochaeta sp. DS3sAY3a]|nr:phospholipase D/nuclease [Pyrenochaeta sp. DS3sAY3a]
MTHHPDLPAHVHPSIREINDVLLGIGGLGYTICYVLMTRQSIRDRTYSMPLFCLAFNFAWEIVFALFVAEYAKEKVIFTIWMVIDLGLVYSVVMYGENEWRHAPIIGRNIGKIFTGMLAWWCLTIYAVSSWWLDPKNPVNPKEGKIYMGIDGIDTDELGFWTALIAQAFLSVMSLAQIMVRGNSGGSSNMIWATRFVGSLSGLNVNYGYCWWVWPEAHGYFAHPLAIVLMITWVLADLGFFIVLRSVSGTEIVTASGRKVKGSTSLSETKMASDDEDEDLKQAIAMSLQQSPPSAQSMSRPKNETIDHNSDSEDIDDDVRRAIALSLTAFGNTLTSSKGTAEASSNMKAAPSPASGSPQPTTSDSLSSKASEPAPKPFNFIAMDRKAMEQARLARLGKRKREQSPERPRKQTVQTQSLPRTLTTQPTSTTKLSESLALQYPRGAIKRTYAKAYPRTNDITIDELLEASAVNIAVISSFMWDAEWLHKNLDPCKIKQIWIMNAKDNDVQQRWIQEMKDTNTPNLKIHFPPMGGLIQSMHSKFMLLFGTDKLRFVVPTANMTQIDWGDPTNDWQPGVMENSVFLIDLPRRTDGAIGKRSDLTRFGEELIRFLEEQKLTQNVIDGVLKFDFSQTTDLAFVHSIAGVHRSPSEPHTGLSGLAKSIQALQLDKVKEIQLDYAASSLGAINDGLLERIYLAARGEQFTTKSKVHKVRDHIKIYYPTHETVEKSFGGFGCAGIISLTKQNFNASSFPRECLRDYQSTRRDMLSHNKLLFARGRKQDGKAFAWVYIGSANISESAWGGQKVLKSGSLGSLNIRNWECGVVMPVPPSKLEELRLGEDEIPPMSVFEGTIEVPFVIPGATYGNQKPWFLRFG